MSDRMKDRMSEYMDRMLMGITPSKVTFLTGNDHIVHGCPWFVLNCYSFFGLSLRQVKAIHSGYGSAIGHLVGSVPPWSRS